ENDANVWQVLSSGSLLNVIQIIAVDVHRINGSAVSYAPRRPNSEPSGPCANIGHARTFLDPEDVHDSIGLKFFVPFRILKDRKVAGVWLARRTADSIRLLLRSLDRSSRRRRRGGGGSSSRVMSSSAPKRQRREKKEQVTQQKIADGTTHESVTFLRPGVRAADKSP